jgi:peptidoglycan/LPS O-acetylase OafA/YrhL
MQLAQFTGLGLVVVGGLLAFLLRDRATRGASNALAQTLAGVVIGLLGALAILTWTTDLIPDDVEVIGAVVVALAAAVMVVVLRLRTGG